MPRGCLERRAPIPAPSLGRLAKNRYRVVVEDVLREEDATSPNPELRKEAISLSEELREEGIDAQMIPWIDEGDN